MMFFVVEIHSEKFIKFKILKITHQEKDIKMIRKIIILKCSWSIISILDNRIIIYIYIYIVLIQNKNQNINNENIVYNPQMDRVILSQINFISSSCIFSTFACMLLPSPLLLLLGLSKSCLSQLNPSSSLSYFLIKLFKTQVATIMFLWFLMS